MKEMKAAAISSRFCVCSSVVDRCPSDERFFRWQTDISVLQ